jgi:hypothetical protein
VSLTSLVRLTRNSRHLPKGVPNNPE